jgi:hypothetical protein
MVTVIRAASGGAQIATRRFDNVQREAFGAGAAVPLSAMATGARRALRFAACAASVLALAYLAPVGRRGGPLSAVHDREVTSRPPERSVPDELNSVPGAYGPRLKEAATALRDPSTSEKERLHLVDELSRDPSNSATAVLTSNIHSRSLLVSMASIRALRGRPCGLVEMPLLQWTAHGAWQRRAWAAKVLGENRCTNAILDLKLHLTRERDSRVRRQLFEALATLGVRTG